jgi:glyoxylase-like metal-dependent hydrolase (beta-lactamase superfamily II)
LLGVHPQGDPNSGVIVGDDAVMVIDAQATPLMAREVIRRIRKLTPKPIRYVVLTHYHAVRVLGASAYRAEHIIASDAASRGSSGVPIPFPA